MKQQLIITALILITGLSCAERDLDDLLAPESVGVIVVDALLIATRTNPEIRLSVTLAPGAIYTRETAALRGATVSITHGTEIFEFREGSTTPGKYWQSSRPHLLIRAGETYHLTVVAADGRVVTASTTVPDRIRIEQWVLLDNDGGTVKQSWPPFGPCEPVVHTVGFLEARVQVGAQIGYQVGLESLSSTSELLIDPDDFGLENVDFPRKISSPPFDAADGSIRLPWFAIFYSGEYRLFVYAMDRNWFDLVRSTPGLQGGPGFGGEAGDSFNRPIFHVEGGIGFFGSASLSARCFEILPNQ